MTMTLTFTADEALLLLDALAVKTQLAETGVQRALRDDDREMFGERMTEHTDAVRLTERLSAALAGLS